jgi:hypothetical protein
MSSPKHKRPRTVDVTAWVLGSTIVVLATLDLLVWASLRNVPNPVSKFFAGEVHAATPVRHVAGQ